MFTCFRCETPSIIMINDDNTFKKREEKDKFFNHLNNCLLDQLFVLNLLSRITITPFS